MHSLLHLEYKIEVNQTYEFDEWVNKEHGQIIENHLGQWLFNLIKLLGLKELIY